MSCMQHLHSSVCENTAWRNMIKSPFTWKAIYILLFYIIWMINSHLSTKLYWHRKRIWWNYFFNIWRTNFSSTWVIRMALSELCNAITTRVETSRPTNFCYPGTDTHYLTTDGIIWEVEVFDLGWWVCVICYPLTPTPPTFPSQIILPVPSLRLGLVSLYDICYPLTLHSFAAGKLSP